MAGFPIIPFALGVPALARDVSAAAFGDPTLLIADAVSFVFGSSQAEWGVYQDGAPVILCDNVVSVGYRKEWSLSDYPVEQGGFETYDKVETPFEATVRFTAGGSEANRQDLLVSIEAVAGTLELFDVVTPERTYSNANIVRYDYRRTANAGVGLLVVDVRLLEVRQDAVADFSSTKTPNGSSQVNDGSVQPVTPSDSDQSSYTSQLAN